jgi:hypothetical protein
MFVNTATFRLFVALCLVSCVDASATVGCGCRLDLGPGAAKRPLFVPVAVAKYRSFLGGI